MSTLKTCADQGERMEGGLGIRDVLLVKDSPEDHVNLHAHRFDHVMFFAEGTAIVTAHCPCGKIETHDVKAGDSLLIPATWEHDVVAVSARVKFWCVFPAFDKDGQRQGDCTSEAT